MRGPIAIVGDVAPTPTDDELVAIAAALEWAWPRPVVFTGATPRGAATATWRFSGRWWNNHPLTSRPRP